MMSELETELTVQQLYRPLRVGDRVHLPEFGDDGNAVEILGTIAEIDGGAAAVRWDEVPPGADSALVERYETQDLIELRV